MRNMIISVLLAAAAALSLGACSGQSRASHMAACKATLSADIKAGRKETAEPGPCAALSKADLGVVIRQIMADEISAYNNGAEWKPGGQ